ncbi:hypothetical protein A4A49_11974 [Nicotiana attenuata]|uniref:Uncharacterized protein n=1 Tax=Nicotiana attenuata TaxID=49451 RepID=A0A314KRT5_NICAT|nr:hypothetical protein A4A49_11974 [Nicotiana attenuata]
MEVKRHAEEERRMIAKEVVEQFQRDERSAIVDGVLIKVKEYFDEKFEKLFKIVDKSNGMDDVDFDLMKYRQYDRMNDSSNIYRILMLLMMHRIKSQMKMLHVKKWILKAINMLNNKLKRNVPVDIAKGNLFGDGDHAPVATEELTSSDVCTTIEKGNCGVENSCASIDTTQTLSDDAELNEDRIEKILQENTPMLLDVAAQLNETGGVDIDKGMQPGETTVEDKRQERLNAAQKEIGELIRLYEKGEIHLFTPIGTQTGISEGNGSGSVGMQTPSVSQHLDQISSDALEFLPNPKRRKMSSSPNVLCDTSDIPDFNLCSFSLGSTQVTSSEGNSIAVVVGEERQEHREQQGVGQVSATMAVDFSSAAEPQQLVITEQQEEQAKRKPDKKGKRIRMESIWLKSPYVIPKQKRRGQDWRVGKTTRRCPFHYVNQDSGLMQRFTDWLKTDASEYNSNPFRLAGIDIPKSFFTEFMDSTSDLSDEVSY